MGALDDMAGCCAALRSQLFFGQQKKFRSESELNQKHARRGALRATLRTGKGAKTGEDALCIVLQAARRRRRY